MDFWRWKGMFSAELTPLSLEAPLVGDPAPAVLCWFPVLSPKRDLQAPQFLEVWASLFLLNRGGILKTHIRPCFRSDKHCCFFSCSRSGKLKKKKEKRKQNAMYLYKLSQECCLLWTMDCNSAVCLSSTGGITISSFWMGWIRSWNAMEPVCWCNKRGCTR